MMIKKNDFNEILAVIWQTKKQIFRTVNHKFILMYWKFGKYVNEKSILFFFLTIFFISCTQPEDTPYIIFKNAAGDVIISDAWNVNIDTVELLYIECGFVEDGHILYERQIDDEPTRHDLIFEQSEDIKIVSVGTKNNLCIENAIISTTFDSRFMTHGSSVKITVRDRSEMAKTFTYIVR